MNADVHRHVLAGCQPRPMASYLKALGVLRILGEQTDPSVRGAWQEDGFVVWTRLSRDEILSFFLWEWQPSPFVSPWNKGSGLLSADPKGVDPVLASRAPRFARLRDGIATAKDLTVEMERAVAAEKALKNEKTRIKDAAGKKKLAEDPVYKQRLSEAGKACKRLKEDLQPECQRRWRGGPARWLRAAIVISADGKASFPGMLGTGGNDGKLDFTNNALQRLGDLFDLAAPEGNPRPLARERLEAALFGEPHRSLVAGGIGQFGPGNAGGANTTSFSPLGGSQLNPWDLPLLLEGSILFAAGTSRRLGAAGSERTAAPFYVHTTPVGAGSVARADGSVRGEQWLPLWRRPWSAPELEALLSEGRCQLGVRPAQSGLDTARAIARLGVARGITEFERYGYFERNGQSTFAVPLGRFAVRAEAQSRLLDDLEAFGWWERLRRAAGDAKAPTRLRQLETRLGNDVMAVLQHGGEAARWQEVLTTLAEIEHQIATSDAFSKDRGLGPLPRLSPEWVTAIDDGGPEVRLALALAGACARIDGGKRVDPVRHHWLPLNAKGGFASGENGFAKDPRVVMTGRDPLGDLVRLVQRRLVEGTTGGSRTLALWAWRGTETRLTDIVAWLRGGVDIARCLWLARGLSALDFARMTQHRPRRPAAYEALDAPWAVLRLCHLPGPLPDGRRVGTDPAIVRLLSAGEAARAFSLALGRLQAAGVVAPIRAATATPEVARRLAASLAFPISMDCAAVLARDLDPAHTAGQKEVSDAT